MGEIIQVLDRCSLEELSNIRISTNEPTAYKFYGQRFCPGSAHRDYKTTRRYSGVVHDSKAYQLKAPIGSAGLFATLPDLLTFVQCFMNNRYPSGKPLFSEKMFTALWSMNQGDVHLVGK